jgi:hypothetical protein
MQLSDIQRQILTTACERKSGFVLPTSTKLKGGALKQVVNNLVKQHLVQEIPAGPKHETRRTGEDGTRFRLKVTKAGCEAVGLKPKGRAAKPVPSSAATASRRR